MLTHVTDGRARLRHAALRGARAEEVAAMLRTRPGITNVTANPRTGGLLVLFEPKAVRIRELAEELERTLPAGQSAGQAIWRTPAERPSPLRSLRDNLESCLNRFAGQKQAQRRLIKRGMFLALGGALAALTGSNRAHAVLGGAFVLLAAAHLHQNRRTLMR